MKKLLALMLCCVIFNAYAEPDQFFRRFASSDRPCLKWKKVCYQYPRCFAHQKAKAGCFRCVKSHFYGFNLYQQQINRNTCSWARTRYFATMGYRCYRIKAARSQSRNCKKQRCGMQCIQYEARSVG